MSELVQRIKDKIPWPIGVALWAVLSGISLFLIVLFLPFALIYEVVLPVVAFRSSRKTGKDVVVIVNRDKPSDRVEEILQLTGKRAMHLEYADRKNWPTFEIAVQLFNTFGPKTKPSFLTPSVLPGVLVLNGYKRPKKFSFGSLCKDPEAKMQELHSALIGQESPEQ